MATAPPPTAPIAPPVPPVGPPPVLGPRWGYQASFIQLRQPAFWLFGILLLVTGIVVLNDQLEIVRRVPTSWFFSIALLALYTVPVFLAISLLDLFEREPLSLLVAAVLWGGVVTIGLAAPTNSAWFEILAKTAGASFVAEWGPAIIGPIVEETLKYLGVVMIWLIARSEIDDVLDGFVYGAMIGLGFAVVEDVGYFMRFVAAAGGGDQVGPVFEGFFVRVVASGLYMHVLWSGLTGLGFAYFVTRRDEALGRRIGVAAGAFGAGVVAHFVWNSPILRDLLLGGDPGPVQFLFHGLVKGLPFLVFLALLVILAQRREHRWFAAATESEVGTDVLLEDEVRTLSDLRSRFRARRAMRRLKGPVGEKLLGRLQREQVNLAMVRTRVDSSDHPDLAKQRDLIRVLRAELASLPIMPALPFAGSAPTAAPGAARGPAPDGDAPLIEPENDPTGRKP